MQRRTEGKHVTWINLSSPTRKEGEDLAEEFNLHPLVVDQLVSPSWNTKVEVFPSLLFLTLFFPAYERTEKRTFQQVFSVAATKNTLICSHAGSLAPLEKLFEEYERRPPKEKNSGYLLYTILHALWEDCAAKVQRIDEKLSFIEERIFHGEEKQMLKELSLAKADIIDFWKIVRPQKGVLTSLKEQHVSFFDKELAPYFSHLRNHWARTMSRLFTYRETVQALEDTNNALLNHKTNEIVMTLTIFSVIVFPLTLIASLFGMNTVFLPLVGLRGDFWIIIGIMAAGVLGMLGYFKARRWL
ncbi:magnesium transporter CorA family protein [Patescibacteria group bacterium]|nr:magnesium transporter CorA family protein [Patescibacteria group bacterium]